jgi:hypothetical protein
MSALVCAVGGQPLAGLVNRAIRPRRRVLHHGVVAEPGVSKLSIVPLEWPEHQSVGLEHSLHC